MGGYGSRLDNAWQATPPMAPVTRGQAAARRTFSQSPMLCGHRGSGSGVGENSLPSFRAAVAAGLRWVEVDARLTRDGELVARHDPVIDDGRSVSALDVGEALALGATRVADLLGALPADVGINIEVKTALEDALRPPDRTTAAHVADLARRQGSARDLLVSSFDPAALLTVHRLAPGVPTGFITWRGFPLRKAIPAAAHLGANVLVAEVDSFAEDALPAVGTTQAIALAHAAALQVAAWCPGPPDGLRLLRAGVDCLIVDGFTAETAPQWEAVIGLAMRDAPARAMPVSRRPS